MPGLTAQYLPAMQALNDFYAMLYHSMQVAMPGAKFSTTGAYVWRGYRVDSYKNLASNQYYCEIYPENPTILKFQESFLDKGKYHYFVNGKVDLLKENFFSKDIGGQLKFLVDFVESASKEAIDWQDSDDRKKAVPNALLSGKSIHPHKLKGKTTFNQVNDTFIYAYPMQDQLFSLLNPEIMKASEILFSKKVDFRPNASWYNFDYRGFRMKFKNSNNQTPQGVSDYVWRIYFKNPSELICERNKGSNHNPIPPFLLTPDFLSAAEPEQKENLYQFALKSLQVM